MSEFFSDFKVTLRSDALKRIGRKVLEDDCFGLAGQLAYFVLFSLFPSFMFLVALMGLVVNGPESTLNTLTESMEDFLPGDITRLLTDYTDRTLRGAGSGVHFLGALAALWSGSAASYALIKVSNRAYSLRVIRPAWKMWDISVLIYSLVPDADLPFKWVTRGRLTATVLILVASVILGFYVANLARYDQLYGPLTAVAILML